MRRATRLAAAGAALLCFTCDSRPEPAGAETIGDAASAFGPGPGGLSGFFGCLREEGVTLVSAHRGGPARGYPANAMATFERTLSRGFAILEVDVRASADGELVLLHDAELDRRTTCSGVLEETPSSALGACRLRDNEGRATDFPIARLADVLDWAAGRTILQLDVKELSLMEDVTRAVRAAGAEDRVIFITYARRATERTALIDDGVMISARIESEGDLDRLERAGVDLDRIAAWTGTEAPDADLFAAISARGVPVIFGTLGGRESIDREISASRDEARYVRIAEAGADIIATDRADAARRALYAGRDPAAAIARCGGGAGAP